MSEILTPQTGEDLSDERPRLVLDTNTVLALWMFRDPALDVLREWIEAGSCRLYSREDALEELRRVLAYRQFGLGDEPQRAIYEAYQSLLSPWSHSADQTETYNLALLPRCRDTDDQKFLEIAYLSRSHQLLTRDKALLTLARKRRLHDRLEIVTPTEINNRVRSSTHIPLGD